MGGNLEAARRLVGAFALFGESALTAVAEGGQCRRSQTRWITPVGWDIMAAAKEAGRPEVAECSRIVSAVLA
jgi:hypothetical protein